jgi:hypothetical protein
VSFLAVTVGASNLFCVALVSPEVEETEVLLLLFGDIAVRAWRILLLLILFCEFPVVRCSNLGMLYVQPFAFIYISNRMETRNTGSCCLGQLGIPAKREACVTHSV